MENEGSTNIVGDVAKEVLILTFDEKLEFWVLPFIAQQIKKVLINMCKETITKSILETTRLAT